METSGERMAAEDHRKKLTIFANGFRIKGHGHMVPGSRVTDYANDSSAFIALTDAEVWETETGRKLASAPFMNVGRDSIEIIIPE